MSHPIGSFLVVPVSQLLLNCEQCEFYFNMHAKNFHSVKEPEISAALHYSY